MSSHAKDVSVIAISKIIRLMEEKGVATTNDLVGVSEQEIQVLEEYFQLAFPKSYRQFLTAFGRSAGFLSPWVAIYYDDLKEIRDTFDLYLAQGLEYQLPDGALIIANIENTFDFIQCKGDHDPSVYRVDFRDEPPLSKRLSVSFSDYLEHLVNTSDARALPQDFFDDDMDDNVNDLINYY